MGEVVPGKFLVLEGQGFTGKTEQAQLLAMSLLDFRLSPPLEYRIPAVKVTQEPGGVPEADQIRQEILAKRAEGKLTPWNEVELFYESRRIFLDKLVLPALSLGEWVVGTRFSASTEVYQGHEGGVSLERIRTIDSEVVGQNQPHLYILLDVPEDVIMSRMIGSGRSRHSFNELDMDKLRGRRSAYLQLALENRYQNWEVVNGDGSIPEVRSRIWDKTKERLLTPAALGLLGI